MVLCYFVVDVSLISGRPKQLLRLRICIAQIRPGEVTAVLEIENVANDLTVVGVDQSECVSADESTSHINIDAVLVAVKTRAVLLHPRAACLA